jgi:DNA-binding MarR family transcriptional regulator
MERKIMATPRIREKHEGATAQTEVRVWLRLLSCATIIEKRLRRRFVARFDTTLPRFDVMAALERHPEGISMGELSRSLLVSNGNVTALVRQLQSDGFTTVRPDPRDGRSSIVALTEQGRRHFAELAAAHRTWIKRMFAGIPRADQKALYDLLAVLKLSIAADDGDRE